MVLFNDLGEFLTELRMMAGFQHIDDQILRVTGCRKLGSPFVRCSVVAGFGADYMITCLELSVGEYMNGDEDERKKQFANMADIVGRIVDVGKELGLDVRPGRFVECRQQV